MKIQSDRGLQLRMLGSTIACIAWMFGFIWYMGGTEIHPIYPIFFAVGIAGSIILQLHRTYGKPGKRGKDHDQYPQLRNRLETLSLQANVQTPELRIEKRNVPNALTFGILPGGSSVIVTEEMIERLDEEELDAVLAHEIAHIHNKDSFVMSALAVPADTARKFCYLPAKYGRAAVLILLVLPFFGPIALVLNLQMAVMSRYREYAADRGSVAITGNKYALMSAIQKLTDEDYDEQNTDLRDAYPSAVTFYGKTWLQPDPQDRVAKIKQIQMD